MGPTMGHPHWGQPMRPTPNAGRADGQSLAADRGDLAGRTTVRLHQRLSRCRQHRRDRDRVARDDAFSGGRRWSPFSNSSAPCSAAPPSPTPSAVGQPSTSFPARLSLAILLCGLLGAIAWNLATWYFGIPSSSSHALVGGLIGAVSVAVGSEHVAWGFRELAAGHLTGIVKVLAALLLSPLVGFWVGFLLHRLLTVALRTARPAANARLRGAQFVTTAGLAFAHGANDAQKSMGILAWY